MSVDDRLSPTSIMDQEKSYDDQMFKVLFSGRNLAEIARCAALFSVAEHLSDGPRTAEDVAAAENLHVESTRRFLRACVAHGLVHLDPDKRFTSTPLLATLRKGHPASLREFAISHLGFGQWAAWGRLDQALRTGEAQMEAALGREAWSYYGSAEGAVEGAALSRAISGMGAPSTAQAADVIDTTSVAFAVDVGGGTGSVLHALATRNPALRGAILDLAHVEGEAVRATEAANLADRIVFVAGDFTKEVPVADLYILRWILHDWPDETCVEILRACSRSARTGARLFILEIVMRDEAPDPFSAGMDLNMLVLLNGARERTLRQFADLLAAGGFHLERLHEPGGPLAIIEAVVARNLP